MTAASFAPSGPSHLELPHAQRAAILRRGLGVLLAAAGVALVAAALIPGDDARTLSIGIGAAVGLGFTATWLVGAVKAFTAPWDRFGLATFGLWPLRAFVAVVVVLGGTSAGLDLLALVLAWLAAQVVGFAVEAWAFSRLAELARYTGPPPATEGTAP